MKVLYFSQASIAADCREEEWAVSEPMDLGDFWREAIRRHPLLADIAAQCRVASGMQYVGTGGQLDPAQEAAVIPPVSGG